jgi:hypothetical protein
MAKNLVELPRLVVLCFFFTMAFYPIVTPNVEWAYVWGYCCAAAFACSGLAYCASIALSPLKVRDTRMNIAHSIMRQEKDV